MCDEVSEIEELFLDQLVLGVEELDAGAEFIVCGGKIGDLLLQVLDVCLLSLSE